MRRRAKTQGLKAIILCILNAALEGSLFHGWSKSAVVAGLIALSITIIPAGAQVTFERLVNSAKEPQNWMTYSGDYSGKRFSGLNQINKTNAHTMVAKWVYQTGATGKLETSPLAVDGILYATASR